jgi:hypothetical protein
VAILLWRHGRWRCEFVDSEDGDGKVILYVDDRAILARRCESDDQAEHRSLSLKILVHAASSRASSGH